MSQTMVAGGNISVCRFVEISAAHTVTQCNATTDKPWGISQEYAREAPLPDVTLYAAKANDPVKIYTVGDDDVLLELGGTVAAGDYLSSHTDGTGLNAGADLTYGARAKEAGVAGDRIRVTVLHGSTESS